jgi:hypothetical protein
MVPTPGMRVQMCGPLAASGLEDDGEGSSTFWEKAMVAATGRPGTKARLVSLRE